MRSLWLAFAGFAVLLVSGCYDSHVRPEGSGAECVIDPGPLRGTFDGEPWAVGWGQSWPAEDEVYAEDVAEVASCWPTPPRSRIYVMGARTRTRDDDAVDFFLATGDLNLEYPATALRIELIESEADWITVGVCARDVDTRHIFEVSGRYRVPRCSP